MMRVASPSLTSYKLTNPWMHCKPILRDDWSLCNDLSARWYHPFLVVSGGKAADNPLKLTSKLSGVVFHSPAKNIAHGRVLPDCPYGLQMTYPALQKHGFLRLKFVEFIPCRYVLDIESSLRNMLNIPAKYHAEILRIHPLKIGWAIRPRHRLPASEWRLPPNQHRSLHIPFQTVECVIVESSHRRIVASSNRRIVTS